MAEQQSLPVDAPPPAPAPGPASDTRDGITVESNTSTAAELKTTLDQLDTAIEQHEDSQPAPVEREEKSGRFTSKQRRSNPVARMEEATAREATAKREAAEAKAETLRLRQELTQRSQPQPPQPPPQSHVPPPPADPEPDPADAANYPAGEFDPQYMRDVGRWEARQEYRKQRAVEQQQHAFNTHIKTVEGGMSAYAKRMKEAFPEPEGLTNYLKALPPELVNLRPTQVQNLMMPGAPLTAGNVIADCVVESDQPTALTNYLKDHPQDLQRLLTLHPIQVFREMGRLDERIAATAARTRTAPPREPVSRARPPVQRVESVPQISDDPPGESASDEEHVAYYNRKEMARRYGRG